MLAALVVLLSGVLSSNAQSTSPTGVDILFLVDQSGSMRGKYTQPTDPNGWRFEAMQLALNRLSEYRLRTPSPVEVQMSVIYFGDADKIQTALDWTKIAETPDTWDAVPLLDQLSLANFGAENDLGNTDFAAAFENAKTAFDQLAPPADGSTHLRLVVLLTDGDPCVPTEFDCATNAGAKFDHMDEVLELTQRYFPDPDYQLYVMALDDRGILWPTYRSLWEEVVRDPAHAVQLTTPQQMGDQIWSLLVQLKLIDITGITALTPGTAVPVEVSPYHSTIKITLIKPDTLPGTVQMQQPDGSSLSSTAPQVSITGQDQLTEEWTISAPAAGTWQFTAGQPGDQLSPYLELIPVQAQAELPTEQFVKSQTAQFTLRLTDTAGKPLADYGAPYGSTYALTVEATITKPDASIQTIPLTDMGGGAYQGSITFDQGGEYVVGVKATSANPSGAPLTVYQNERVGSLMVSDFQVQTTVEYRSDWALQQTTEFVIRVSDTLNNPLPSSIVLQVEADLTLPNGSQQPLTLTDLGSGLYETSATPLEAGEYAIGVTVNQQNADGTLTPMLKNPEVGTFTIGDFQFTSSTLPSGDRFDGQIDTIEVTALDASGQPLVRPGLGVTAMLVADDGTTLPFVLTDQGNGLYAGDVRYSTPGQYRLIVRATLPDAADATQQVILWEMPSSPIVVRESEKVTLTLVEPGAKKSIRATGGFPPFSPTKLDVVLETRSAKDGQLLDIHALAIDPTQAVLTGSVTDGDGKTQTVNATPDSEQAGRYRLTLDDFAPGEWTVDASIQGQLLGEAGRQYIIDPDQNVVTSTITVTRNPMIYAFWGGAGVAGVLVVGTLGMVLRGKMVRRHHVCLGRFTIVRVENYGQDSTTLLDINLGNYNSNKIRLSKRQLPRQPKITQIDIECSNEEMHRSRRVIVTVRSGKQMLLNRRMMSPGSAFPLQLAPGGKSKAPAVYDDYFGGPPESDVSYEVRKDPDDLFNQDRGSMFF